MFSNEARILPFSCREDAGFVLSRIFCGGRRVLIVYGGKSAVRSGVLDRAEKSLAEAGISSWARYVYKDCLPRFVRFARNVMGVTADGTDEEIALKGIDAMVDFYHSIGMPVSFHELGIDPTDAQIDEMARRCLETSGSALGSAKKLSLDDMIAIYHAANH